MTKVGATLPGVILMDTDGNYIDITGDVTSLDNITIVASALPDGAATQTTLAAINTAIGAKTDAAWNGSDGSASVISLLKAIALNTTPAP